MREIKNQKLIENFINSYNSFDIEGMVSLLNPDIEFVNISGNEVNVHTYGIEQFIEIANQGKSLFSSRNQTIKNISFIFDEVHVEISFEAVLANDLPDGLKKGEIIRLGGRSEYVIKNGLIIKITDIS